MNTKIIIPIIGIASLFLFSCDENYEHEKSISLAKEVAADVNAEEVETDSSRTVIKSAELSLRVDTVEKRIQQIQQKVNQMQGHILHYEIQSNKNYIDKVEYSLDSSYEVNQINPHAQIRLRIPVEYTDTFIHQMLSMNMRLDEFLLDENDVTEDLFEKKEIAEINISGKTKPKTIIQQSYLEERLAEKLNKKPTMPDFNTRQNICGLILACKVIAILKSIVLRIQKRYELRFIYKPSIRFNLAGKALLPFFWCYLIFGHLLCFV
ncbi:MAG: DUF4349 domain-containing protein [Bacteroidetes bacterium]|nr:DUF4349 domain-containing protein [Bacteroidota bacterium]